MTKKHSTKRSLIASVLLLALCITSFVGTTFAWFTDSVTSGSNVIKTGNLDIVLEYWDGDSWEDAEGNIIPFVAADGRAQSDILWEPGCTYKMAPIRVRNEGSLNAKILITINGVTGDSKLLEVINFNTTINNIPQSVLEGSAGNQLAQFEGKTVNIMYGMKEGNIVFDWSLAGKGTTTPGTGHTDTSPEFTISAHMDEKAGNEYQNLAIEGISITVLATQQIYEYDSFGNNYDKEATFPEVSFTAKGENETTEVAIDNVKIDVPANAPAGDYEIVVSNKNVSTDANGNTTVSMDIDLKKSGVKVESAEGVSYTVSINVGLGKIITGVTHNGQAISEYSYENGILTFTTDSFSPFAFTYCDDPAYGKVAMIGETYYETLEAALDAAAVGDTILLIADLTNPTYGNEGGLNIKKAINLDLGGKTITDGWIRFYADATIQNGYLKNVTKSSPIYVENGTLTVENLSIEDSKSQQAIYLRSNNTALNFNNSSILLTKGANNTSTNGIYGIYSSYDNTTVNIKNGSTITVDGGTTTNARGIFSSSKMTVNLTDSKIYTSGSNYSYGIDTKTGDIEITGGEIVTNKMCYTLENGITYSKNYAIYAGGNVTIRGAKITTNGPSSYIVYTRGNDQKITISNVEFANVLSEIDKSRGWTAPNMIYSSNAATEITSGVFNGFSAALGSTPANVSVKGGTFDAKPSTIANGYEAVDNGNGTWTVSLAPSGKLHGSYISETTIWAECSANATESLVIKVYSGDTYLGSTSLNNIDGILNGNVVVTWHLSLDTESDGDEYWAQEWTVRPTKDLIPDRAVLYVDGKQVDERSIELNGPDNLNKINVAIADENGNIVRFCTTFPSIDDIPNGYTIIQLRDIDLNDFANMFG